MQTATTIRITLNGAPRELRAGTSVSALVDVLGLPPDSVAVEVGDRLVRRSDRTERVLVDGDRVEVVTLVGGG